VGGDAVEFRKHSTLTQDTDIVERSLDSSEHYANSGLGLVHLGLLPGAFGSGGVQGSEGPAARLEWASLVIYLRSEMRVALFDTIAHFFLRREGGARATSG
jgi:hypothetical protein